jgi:hypothetical protein
MPAKHIGKITLHIFVVSLLGLWQETGNTGIIDFCIIQQFAKLE